MLVVSSSGEATRPPDPTPIENLAPSICKCRSGHSLVTVPVTAIKLCRTTKNVVIYHDSKYYIVIYHDSKYQSWIQSILKVTTVNLSKSGPLLWFVWTNKYAVLWRFLACNFWYKELLQMIFTGIIVNIIFFDVTKFYSCSLYIH